MAFPLHILWQEGITPEMLSGVFDGIRTVLSLAGVSNEMILKFHGQRRQPNWLTPDGKELNEHQSLDWYIWWARQNSPQDDYLKGHLNSTAILNLLTKHPTFKTEPRYEFVVVKELLYFSDASPIKIRGAAEKDQGTIITLAPYLELLQPVEGESNEDKKKREFLYFLGTKMLMTHETGHVLWLHNTERTGLTDEEMQQIHCPNECVMCGPYDPVLEIRIQDDPFCPKCKAGLKQYRLKP